MKKRKIEIEYIPTKDLIPYAGNVKIHTSEQVAQIMRSIEQFGFNDPIAIWKNNEIIEGHGRLLAAEELKIKQVPVIRLDKLTDSERKAYTLAHNMLTLNTGFDIEKLAEELEDIEDIDMTDFGFDMPELDIEVEEEFEDEDGYYGDERERTFNSYNLSDFDPTRAEGPFDMPIIKACDYVPTDLIGFNYVLSAKEYNTGVHFYVDDYQFERVWNMPQLYIEKMRPFECVLTPDFSLYLDMPGALKVWNVYRSRLIGQLCQDAGLKVIPTVSWAEPATFEWCFDGLPKNATLSVSTVGVKQSKDSQNIWKQGMDAMIKKLKPKRLLVYGGALDYNYGQIEVIEYKNHVTDRMGEA